MARQAAGSVFGEELVSVLTQLSSQDRPRAGVVHVVVPFLAVHHAAGPRHTLLTSQGQSYVWVGELVNAPKMYCVFEQCACACYIFSSVVSLLVF